MLRAVVWARGEDEEEELNRDQTQVHQRSGLGLWYPSPSEYEPLAFLASLTDSLAAEIKRRYRAQHPIREWLRSNPLWTIGLPILVAVGVFSLPLAFYGVSAMSRWAWLITAVLFGFVIALVVRLPTAMLPDLRREERLVREATLAAERARYSATRARRSRREPKREEGSSGVSELRENASLWSGQRP